MEAVSPASNSSPSPAFPSTPSPPRIQSPPPNPSGPSTPTPSPPGPSSPPPSRQPSVSSPPPASGSPPPLTPALSPPPATPPPTPSHAPPPSTPDPPPPSATPPVISTPPTPSNPPPNLPPPPAAEPPPPISSTPPQNSPPPPPPPQDANPPVNPPPPPQPTNPPEISPPTRPSAPPETSPPPPPSIPPRNSPPPERLTPSSSPLKPLPPPSNSPPPPSLVSPPGQSGNRTDNSSVPNGGVNPNSNSDGIGTGGVIAIGVVAGIVVLSIVGFVVWYIRKPRRNDSGRGGHIMPSSMGSSPKSGSSLMKVHSTLHQDRHDTGGGSGSASGGIYSPKELGGLGNSRSMFTYEELFKATSAFSAQNLLGEGGFGSVYKGYLPDGREVAVKKLKIGGGQGDQEFKAEVEIIGRVHHRYLVCLIGYCISEHRRLLVYDYVPNNSLYYHLHVKGDGQLVLDWARRAKIAAGAARGIAYLHEDCHPRIIHRDIKSSNILLDQNFEARVSDFGLAKLALDAETHISTRVVGTFGYVAPEYASSGKLTERSDVYSFGVVLLELITGRKAVDASQPMGNESLVEWARPLLNHALDSQDFETLVDPRLEKNYVESEVLKMIGIAAACVRHASAKRPQMGQVVRAFDTLAATDLSNGMRFGESQAFDSGQKSAEAIFIRMLTFGNEDYSSGFYSQGSSNA